MWLWFDEVQANAAVRLIMRAASAAAGAPKNAEMQREDASA